MIYKKINLKEFYPLENDVYMYCYSPSNFKEINLDRKRKTVLVLPGGGYEMTSDREGEPIALKLIGENLNAFVLHYTTKSGFKFPYPLIEVYAAVLFIKEHATEYNVDINSISVMGFSAGANLAGAAACHYNDLLFAKMLNTSSEKLKTSGCVLGYPVVTSYEFSHEQSIHFVSQDDPKLKEYFSLEKNITNNFVPTFIWHSCKDSCVPVENSLLLANALSKNNVLFELHIYPDGEHGQSLANECVYNETYQDYYESIEHNRIWIIDAIRFLKKYC